MNKVDYQAKTPKKKVGLPLSALLSQALVAFTIEFDNEFEHQMPHRTTKYGNNSGWPYAPWLTSMAMWFNCMRFVDDKIISVNELKALTLTTANLGGMERWGYIYFETNTADDQPNPLRDTLTVRAKPGGLKARELWPPLFPLIEERWQARFGKEQIDDLHDFLWAIVNQLKFDLPDCLPILGYGLYSGGPVYRRTPNPANTRSTFSLPALLSKVLLIFALEFERESGLSLAISANVLRVTDKEGIALNKLPVLSGVSKEAINMAIGVLQEKKQAVLEPDANRKGKVIRLTAKGLTAKKVYAKLTGKIEANWKTRFGEENVCKLRELLEQLTGVPTAQMPPLFSGLQPYPDGWRASVRKPETLPHYPMVLHRGGYPDGS